MTPAAAPPRPRARASRPWTLWRLLPLVLAGHVLLTLLLSPGLFRRGETLDDLYARGEKALQEGRYVEAQQTFARILERQPKPPPLFAKAAEQHRLADRMLRQQAPATQPTTAPSVSLPQPPPATRPNTAEPQIPPELRR